MMSRHATSSDLTTPDAMRFGQNRAPHHNIIVFITQHNGAEHPQPAIPAITRLRAVRHRTACHLHQNVTPRLRIDPSYPTASQLSP